MTWDNIAAFFIQPAIGSFSDRVNTRIGRRLPFIIPGVIFGALFFYLFTFSRNQILLIFLLNIVIFNIIMALYRSPAASLMPDLIKSEDRSIANALINITGAFAAGMSLYIGGIYLESKNIDGAFKFISILMISFLIVLLVFIREPKLEEIRLDTVSTQNESFTKELLDEIKKLTGEDHRSLLFMLLAITFWFTAVFSIEAFISTYIWRIFLPDLDSEIAAGEAGRLLYIFPISFVLFAIFGGLMGRSVGRIISCKIGGFIMITGTILAVAIDPTGSLILGLDWRTSFLIALFFAGAGWGMATANSIVIVWELTKDNGIGTGMYYAFTSLAAILGPTLAGVLMSIFGVRILFLFSLTFFILGTAALLKVKIGETGDKEKYVLSDL